MEMISLFMTEQPTMDSDAVLLISDKGNYEASVDSLSSMTLNIPLYILHLGEEQAPIYNDAFLETIQNSNGRIILNLDELAQQFNIGDDIMSNQSGIDYSIIDNPNGDFDDNYSELVSKAFIENSKIKNDLNRVKQLDEIHQIALKEQIVTTYSSMIVLVNEVQKAALRKAELEADRFDREVESGNETTSKPSNAFNVSGVPEPHEWIMIFLVSALLLFSYYQKKFKFVK